MAEHRRARRPMALALAGSLAASTLAVAAAPIAQAATGGTELYAISAAESSGGNLLDQTLYRIDADTGAAAEVVDLQIDDVRGMDFSPIDNELYVTSHDQNVDCTTEGAAGIYHVDIETGAAEPVVDTGLFAPDIAFGEDGTLYVWDEFGCRGDDTTSADDMWTVDLDTGTVVELGNADRSTANTGVAVDAAGTIWVKDHLGLFTIDSDGSAVDVALTDQELDNALAIAPDGTFFSIVRDDGPPLTTGLYTIDPSDGTSTLVGDMEIPIVTGLAFRNANPIASDDTAEVNEGQSVVVDVLANDTDAEGDELTPVIVDQPTRGTVEVEPDGTVTYTHDGSETTSDTFTYSAADGLNLSEPATVSVTVIPTGLDTYILGGTSAVGPDIDPLLEDLADGAAPERLAGTDRFETSVEVSQDTFEPGVPVAYVANAAGDDKYPDALAGAPAAALEGGPVLLIASDFVPDAVAAELERLAPGRIVILGGESAVSTEVEAALAAYTTGDVDRYGGSDRYHTSAMISAERFEAGVEEVWIATGLDFADALAAGPAAIQAESPILLVSRGNIPDTVAAELERLDPQSIMIAGGTAAVSPEVETALAAYTDGAVTRVSGTDRFETAEAISLSAFSSGAPVAYVATGLRFPDALAGGVAAGLRGGPVLLAAGNTLREATQDEIVRLNDLA